MIQRVEISRMKFLAKCGPIHTGAARIHPSVFITTADAGEVSRGSVLIHNQALGKRTRGSVEWQLYPDIYAALRGMVHALRGGGAQPDVYDGELQELARYPQILRQCVRLLFSTATEDEFLQSAAYEGVEYLIRSLDASQNESELFARAHLLRGMKLTDALERRNPGAAAMTIGGAIHRIQERDIGLRLIMGRLNVRVLRIVQAIHEATDAYEALLKLFGGPRRQYSESSLFIKLNNRQCYSPALARRALKELDASIVSLRRIVALPHLRNARNTISDLTGMRVAVERLTHGWHQESGQIIEGWIDVIRQAILWFRVSHALQVDVYAPLSWALEDIRRNAKVVRRAVNAPRLPLEEILRDEDRARLNVIGGNLTVFRNRVSRCSDTRLQHRIKAPVLMRVDEAIEFAASGEWNSVKEQLRLAAGLL